MPRITDFPGFSVISTKDGSISDTDGTGINPFAQDTGRITPKLVRVGPLVEDILADARTRPALALRTTTVVVQPKKEEEVKEDTPFVSLFPTSVGTTNIFEKESPPFGGAKAPPFAPPTQPIPMIQPRSKDGQRLLYKHPHCPRVGPKGAYTLLVGQSDKSSSAWLIQFDGGANPNPGPASAGAVLWTPPDLDGKRSVAFEAGKFLGKATNNIGEAQGLLLGLQIAATRGARELLIEGDSELIVFQQTGQYKVSNANLKRWWAEIQAAMMDETCFDWIAIRQVPREQNERADAITKDVLVKKAGFQRA
jgi:ribonuclease HI